MTDFLSGIRQFDRDISERYNYSGKYQLLMYDTIVLVNISYYSSVGYNCSGKLLF
jgi:hypothetical protein